MLANAVHAVEHIAEDAAAANAAAQTNAPDTNVKQNTTFPVHVIQKTGSDLDNPVIVFTGDGYTGDQQDKFISDITLRVRQFLNYEPYKSYANKLNIYAVKAVSNVSGFSSDGSLDTYFKVRNSRVSVLAPEGEQKLKALKDE